MRSCSAVGLALPLILLLLASCSSDESNPNPTGPSDPTGAAAKVVEANNALEGILDSELNGPDPDGPSDVDFRTPFGLYQEALRLDDNNRDAHLGVAVTQLLTLSAEAEVNAAFDEWKAYLDDHVPFEVDQTPRQPLGVPIGPARGREALRLPFDIVPLTMVAQSRTLLRPPPPQISRVQNVIATLVLPRVEEARGHLARVVADPYYTFTVTPRMQGDLEADPALLDLTDFLALRAGCDLLAAACKVATAYQLGLAEYDSLRLIQALTPGSGWLKLLPGGDQKMHEARMDILDAITDTDRALTALLAEQATFQEYDVIKIGPDDLSRADVESIRVNLPHVRAAMENGYTRWDDWDDTDRTPNAPLRLNPGALFSDPVPDWKALLPGYSVTLERRLWDEDWHSSGSWNDTLHVYLPSAGTYHGSSYLEIQNWRFETDDDYWGNNDALREPLRRRLERLYWDRLATQSGFSGFGEIGGSYWGWQTLPAGEHVLPIQVYTYYQTSNQMVLVPTLTWDATTFQTWLWPDPTMNGLMPGMTSTAQANTLFGIDGDGWERQITLDWTD